MGIPLIMLDSWNDLVDLEIKDLQNDIYGKIMKLHMFGRDEKVEHIEKLETLLEKQRLMFTRLSLSDDSEAIKTLFMNGYLFRVSEKLIISKNQRSDLIKIIEKLPQDFSVKEFKEVSNLSRKYTIPFLEFLDRQLITKKINLFKYRVMVELRPPIRPEQK